VTAAIVVEYIELCERVVVEALFTEQVEAQLYERLDQLWYTQMTADDRAEAQIQLGAKARAWHDAGCTGAVREELP
jgi:hypothetical protein